MPTPKKGARLGGSPAHQKLILANLATSLFEHGRITTTEAKARVLRPVAEKLITKAKKGDLHNRRQVLATIRDKGVVHALFEEIAPRYAERPGGYTRITKIGPRKGDNAPMAVIELVTEAYTAEGPGRPRRPRSGRRSRRRRPPVAEDESDRGRVHRGRGDRGCGDADRGRPTPRTPRPTTRSPTDGHQVRVTSTPEASRKARRSDSGDRRALRRLRWARTSAGSRSARRAAVASGEGEPRAPRGGDVRRGQLVVPAAGLEHGGARRIVPLRPRVATTPSASSSR